MNKLIKALETKEKPGSTAYSRMLHDHVSRVVDELLEEHYVGYLMLVIGERLIYKQAEAQRREYEQLKAEAAVIAKIAPALFEPQEEIRRIGHPLGLPGETYDDTIVRLRERETEHEL
jgi:hypothetical protein